MIDCISESMVKPGLLLILLYTTLSISACADKAGLRDEERARYEALENELISAQLAEERQRRTEMQLAQAPEPLESEPKVAEHRRLHKPIVPIVDDNADSNRVQAESLNLADSARVDTQIVLDQTPTEISGLWTLQTYPSPIDGSELCAVVSAPVTVTNGTIETQVSVIISNSTVFLRTDASFDTTAVETGYRIDAGIPMAFDHYLNELTAVVDDSYGRLISALQQGEAFRVSFAYSPQLSSTETHVVEYSLDSIAQLLLELDNCDEQGKVEKSHSGTDEQAKS